MKRVVVDRVRLAGREEVDAGRTEGVDHGQRPHRAARPRVPPARRSGSGAAPRRRRVLPVTSARNTGSIDVGIFRRHRRGDLVGVAVERTAEPARRLVVGEREDDVGLVPRPRPLPQQVEHMLHQRQLVGAAAEAALLVVAAAGLPRREVGEVVEELVDEAVLDPEAADLGRPDDRLAALVAAHARGEVEAAVDDLGQSLDQRAGAEIFRAHRDRDVDRRVLAGGVDQQSDEGLRLLAAGIVLVAEQLLELVDQHHQVGARRQVPAIRPFDQRARTAAEEGREDLDLRLVGLLDALQPEERDRRASGSGGRAAEVRRSARSSRPRRGSRAPAR